MTPITPESEQTPIALCEPFGWSHFYADAEDLRRQERLRSCRTVSPAPRPWIESNEGRLLDFCSNDYLGLSQHLRLKTAATQAIENLGTGTGGARLIGGTLPLHSQLEQAVADWKQTPAALVFNSGYQANIGVITGLCDRHTVILSDKLNHASLIDGAIMSRADHHRYGHGDTDHLERLLKQIPADKPRWIVTDSVFSMDGDLAPLKTIFALAEQYDAGLIVDEAHGSGVLGDDRSSGLWEYLDLPHSPRVLHVGTFSKALGGFGAYVAGSEILIQTLVQRSRSFIYSTSLPPSVIDANLSALEVLRGEPQHKLKLWENIRYFEQCMSHIGLTIQANSAIIPLILGDDAKTLVASQTLQDAGFYVQAIRPPTVPQGSARLRITLSACHEPEHINGLCSALKTLL